MRLNGKRILLGADAHPTTLQSAAARCVYSPSQSPACRNSKDIVALMRRG